MGKRMGWFSTMQDVCSRCAFNRTSILDPISCAAAAWQKTPKNIINLLETRICTCNKCTNWRRGGDQVVSVLAFYSDDPSSNPAEVYSCFFEICGWKEQKNRKRPGLANLKINKCTIRNCVLTYMLRLHCDTKTINAFLLYLLMLVSQNISFQCV